MKRNRIRNFLHQKKTRVKFEDQPQTNDIPDDQFSTAAHLGESHQNGSFDQDPRPISTRWNFNHQLASSPFYTGDYRFDSLDSKFSTMDDQLRDRKRPRTDKYPIKGPRFVPANIDSQMRGYDHGYYIHAAKLDDKNVSRDRESLNLVNRAVLTPRALASAAASSRYSSKVTSRQSSFRASTLEPPRVQRMYKQNKRPANSNNNGQANGFFYTDGSASDVALRIYRKKKRAPPPPPKPVLAKRTNRETLLTVSVLQTNVYPIEPPKDYEAKVEEESEEDDAEVFNNIPSPFVQQPPSPLPLPVDPDPSMLLLQAERNSPAVNQHEPVVDQEAKNLKRQIEEEVQRRVHRNPSQELPVKEPTQQEKFAAELAQAYAKRQERRQKGVVAVIQTQNSKVFPAVTQNSPRPLPQEATKMDFDHQSSSVPNGQSELHDGGMDIDTGNSLTTGWLPAHDLDELKDHEFIQPVNQAPQSPTTNGEVKPKSAFKRLRKSIGRAFGSLGKGLNKQLSSSSVEDNYKEEDGWQIMYQDQNVDAPPDSEESIEVKRVEVQPAFAYNSDHGQLVLLPSHDRIIITKDNKRYRQSDLTHSVLVDELAQGFSGKGKKSKKTPVTDVFGSSKSSSRREKSKSLHEDMLEKERKEQSLVEMQFAAMQQLNRRPTSELLEKRSKSTPNLFSAEAQDKDRDLATSMQHLNLKTRRKPKKIKQLRSRTKSSSPTGLNVRSRSKVLQKGLNYYMKEHASQLTSNPVFSSDDEANDDDDKDHGHFSDSDTPRATVTITIPKQEKHSDSGIGNGSINSHSSNVSTLVADMHVVHDDSFTVTPVHLFPQVIFMSEEHGSRDPTGADIIPPPADFS